MPKVVLFSIVLIMDVYLKSQKLRNWTSYPRTKWW